MIIRFKTSINCGGCVAKVTPFLNSESSIRHWQVDTSNPERVLTVEGDSIDASTVIKAVETAGFRIQPIP